MPKIETPEEFAVRYEQCTIYSSHNLASMVTARDAAIRAESAELLRVCGEALKGTVALLEKFDYTHNSGEAETVKFEATISDDLFYSEKQKAVSALAALKDAGVQV